MRFNLLLTLLVLCGHVVAQPATAHNPFLPTPAPNGEHPTAAPSPATGGAGGQPRLQLPPSIPPPPPGLRLPPVVPQSSPPSPAKAMAPESAASGAAPSDPASAATSAEAKKGASDGFLSRAAIEKARAECRLDLKGPTALRSPAQGALLRVQFDNPGGRRCLMGMQSDSPWAVVRSAGQSAIEIEVQPNPTDQTRATRLVIATANERWTLTLTQAAGTQNLEALELDQGKR